MKIYDYLIIGAGSAGCNIAHFLKRAGKSVAVADKEGIAAGGSGAAGAFLSPLPGKTNPYNSFVNEALDFSLAFYEELLPHAIVKRGVLRVANKNFDDEKLASSAIAGRYLSTDELRELSCDFEQIEGYFYENAAILNPHEVCKELLAGCDFYIKDIETLRFEGGLYLFDAFMTKNIILAQGVIKPLFETPYIKISPIFGVKIDVKTSTKVPFNIHKSISISTNKNDGTLAIGATKERHDMKDMECLTSCEKCPFYVNTKEGQTEALIKEAGELINLQDLEVVKIHRGARATIKSYFPVIGKIIDFDASLSKYPSIKNGTKIPPHLLEYYPNAFIVNAIGSRGFVLAPYLAKILGEHILHGTQIPKELSSENLFYKTARK